MQEAQLTPHGWTEVLLEQLEGKNTDTVVMYGLGAMGILLALSTWLSNVGTKKSSVQILFIYLAQLDGWKENTRKSFVLAGGGWKEN